MATSVKKHKNKIDKIVKGYMREHIKLFINQLFPEDIINVVFDFYYVGIDKWYLKYVKHYINIDGLKVKNTMYHNGSAFGSFIIEKGMIHSWTIKLLNWNDKTTYGGTGSGPWIGIIKDKDDLLKKWYYNTGWARDGSGYAFVCGVGCKEGAGIRRDKQEAKYGEKFKKAGDVMTIILDTYKWTLSYIINGTDYGIAFKDIDQCNYRLAVTISAYMTGTEIELI